MDDWIATIRRTTSKWRPRRGSTDAARRTAEPPLLVWPLDHYYSPVPDIRRLAREPARSRVWPPSPPETPGLNWRDGAQLELVAAIAAQPPLRFPDAPTGDPRDYHAANEMFSRLDAWVLQGMLRHFQPSRMIEVGCGYSTLVTARVVREYLPALEVTCIEPHPPDFLTTGIEGIGRIITSPVEEVPVQTFLDLQRNDVLFIDTAHVAKTGGDVVFLLQEVLPRLNPGVVVHIHDIFLPWDYPPEWVLGGRAWNEQYAVRAFLTFNSAFEILYGAVWLQRFHPEALAAVPGDPEQFRDGGGSLWIRRA